jgi:mannosylglucosylglycerate synthase
MTRSRRIGFISTRFAGTDGVSLETTKWATVLERLGHECFYFAGECDRPAEKSYIVEEAFYRHPAIEAINREAYQGTWGTLHEGQKRHPEIEELHKDFFSVYIRTSQITQHIHELRFYIKEELYKFAHKFNLETLIIENASAIPLNIPLGLAITEFIAETGYPAIAHHHDFHWDRQRFMNNSVRDYLASAFPPNLPSIHHVVINSIQEYQLATRTGIAAMVVPNVMDFDSPPPPPDEYANTVRSDLGLDPGQYLILQPTRIIQRKGIEHAIELTRRLGLPAELVISHASGDEGTDYERRIHEFAALLGVKVHYEAAIVGEARGVTPEGRKIYTLGDVYPYADLVTYPSSIEGFGNAFLEAIYYKRPIVVNNYSIYEADIKPKGFKVVEFDGYISERTLAETCHVLRHPEETARDAEHNFEQARRYFSFTMLERRLSLLLSNCFGENV